MNVQDQVKNLIDSGFPVSIPYLQCKFKISGDEASRIIEHFFPKAPVKERNYYFREYWKKKNG